MLIGYILLSCLEFKSSRGPTHHLVYLVLWHHLVYLVLDNSFLHILCRGIHVHVCSDVYSYDEICTNDTTHHAEAAYQILNHFPMNTFKVLLDNTYVVHGSISLVTFSNSFFLNLFSLLNSMVNRFTMIQIYKHVD